MSHLHRGRGGGTACRATTRACDKANRYQPLSDEFDSEDERDFKLFQGSIACLRKKHIGLLEDMSKSYSEAADDCLEDNDLKNARFTRRIAEYINDKIADLSEIPPDSSKVETMVPSSPQKNANSKKKKKKKKNNPVPEPTVSTPEKRPFSEPLIEPPPIESPLPSDSPVEMPISMELPTPDEKVDPVETLPKPSVVPTPTRFLKVIVKGLPPVFDKEVLASALHERDFLTHKIVQFKKRISAFSEIPEYKDLPIFLIILKDSLTHRKIPDLEIICNISISVELYRGARRQIQCFKCQLFGHAQSSCLNQPRCLKCAEPHPSYLCGKDRSTPPKCCNCGLPHPANFTGCSFRIQNSKQPKRKRFLDPKEKTNKLVRTLEDLKELFNDKEVVQIVTALLSKKEL